MSEFDYCFSYRKMGVTERGESNLSNGRPLEIFVVELTATGMPERKHRIDWLKIEYQYLPISDISRRINAERIFD